MEGFIEARKKELMKSLKGFTIDTMDVNTYTNSNQETREDVSFKELKETFDEMNKDRRRRVCDTPVELFDVVTCIYNGVLPKAEGITLGDLKFYAFDTETF